MPHQKETKLNTAPVEWLSSKRGEAEVLFFYRVSKDDLWKETYGPTSRSSSQSNVGVDLNEPITPLAD